MRERLSDPAPPHEHPDRPTPRSTPPFQVRRHAPPPPAGAPFWLHPFVLGVAFLAVLGLALFLWFFPGEAPSEELTPEELAALLAEPPPPTELPPRWDTPTRVSDLQLVTDPVGAAVRLNSEWVGTTPIQLDDLRPGFYDLRVTRTGHTPKDTSFYLASGSFLHLDLDLDPELPSADVGSSPAAEAAAPPPDRPAAPVTDPPRRVQQRGEPSGGGTAGPEFEVASPEAVRQASHTGSLSVTSNPPGAIVLVDGVPFGRAPLALRDLRPDTYVVTVTLPGYTPLSYQAEVTAQSVAVVKAAFPPREER